MTGPDGRFDHDDVHRHLELGFVSLLAGDRPCGAGMLADATHIVTCAHVVNTALGLEATGVERPAAAVTVAFPYAGGARCTGDVVIWRPVGPPGGDIAVVALSAPAPAGSSPVRLVHGALVDHPFVVWGFPQGRAGEMLAQGVLSRRRSDDLVQMHADDGQAVQPGYSGAPVWDEMLAGVVGIVTSSDADSLTRTSYLLPVDVLAAAWPALPVQISQAAGDAETGVRRVVGERVSAGVESWRDRDELRTRLRELLLAHQRIVCVTGRRGIGKSAVVAKVLAEFERPDLARSPLEDVDGLVYLSTRTQSGVLTLATVFEAIACLTDDDVAARLRRQWDVTKSGALPALWESIRRRRVVVVLDNLDDLQDPATGQLLAEDLVQLLESVCRTPYPPSVVTTSQRPLDLPGELLPYVHEEKLDDGLGRTDALALLRAMRGASEGLAAATDDQLADAAERLSGIPRGLELLAREANRDPLFLDELLASDAAPGTLLAELVSRSFDGLDVLGRQIVGLLAMARVPLPDRGVPDILAGGIDRDACRRTLRSLVASRLLGFDAAARQVRLHPLDADYVQGVLLADDTETQRGFDLCLADWYSAARTAPHVWRTMADVMPNRREFHHRWRAGQRSAAIAVLAEAADFLGRKGESQLLRAAVAAAATADLGVDELVARVDVEWCRYLAEFFDGSLDRAEVALKTGRALAVEACLRSRVGAFDLALGTVLRHRGDAPAAVAVLRPLADDADAERWGRMEALFELGLALCYLSDWDGAEAAAAMLAAILTPEDTSTSRARLADVRSLALLGQGDYGGALAASDEGIALYLDSPQQDNAGFLLNVRGLVRLHLDDMVGAEQELRKAGDLAAEYGLDRLEGLCWTNLAWVMLRTSRWPEARDAAQRGAARLRSNGAVAAAVGEAIAAVLTDSAGDVGQVRSGLERAAGSSRGNTDVYQPPQEILGGIAAAFADSID